jgi:hypothetical protein
MTWDTTYLTVVSQRIQSMGYMTGSGSPMRFFRRDGTAVEARQVASQLDDAPNPASSTRAAVGLRKMSRAEFLHRGQELLRASAGRFHGNLVLNNHPDHFLTDSDWLLGLVAAARAERVAVVNVADLQRWTEAQLASSIRRDGDALQVRVAAPEQELLLAGHGGAVRVDGIVVRPTPDVRFEAPVRVVTLPRGDHRVELLP